GKRAMSPLPLHQMLAAGEEACKQLRISTVLAVVDERGALAAYLRMDGAFFVSEGLAVDKAWTAAGFRCPTAEVRELLSGAPDDVQLGVLGRPRVCLVPGGLPVIVHGHFRGGVGASGGSADQDAQVAKAMLAVATR
ncbi:MAG: heme-binding protein, partial [Pontixanthobacter sp.]